MNIEGSHLVPAEPVRVYARLLDPAVLQQCIPGCVALTKTAENEYAAQLKLGLGAIKGSYSGTVKIADQQAPLGFTMHLSGQGGPGFVQGTCAIALAADGAATRISYRANVQVGGLIAAIGSRLIEAAAKKLSAEFFRSFENLG
jgi:carbon monoxide dehydrogenase subunit G